MIYKKTLTVFMMVTVALPIITCGCKKTLSENTNSRNVDRSESVPLLSANLYLSPSSMAADENANLLYIVQSSAKKIDVFDILKEKVVRSFSLEYDPSAIVLSKDKKHLFVTTNTFEGKIYKIDVKNGNVVKKYLSGHTPVSVVMNKTGSVIYVCNRFSGDVCAIDVNNGKELFRIKVAREPVSAALTGDGKFLFVVNLLPAGPADGNFTAAEVSVIDLAARKVVRSILLEDGSMNLRDICIGPDGKFAYVTHILARYKVPTTQLERGWINTNALAVIDIKAQKLINTVLLDDVELGAANPYDVECSTDGKWLYVSHAGTHEISIIDRHALHQRLDRAAQGNKVTDLTTTDRDVSLDLTFLRGIRKRLQLQGNGPRYMTLMEEKVFVTEYFSESLSFFDHGIKKNNNLKNIVLKAAEQTPQRRGEMLFNDASLCFQKWQSCASCHPSARVDGLNWDLLNDGIGNAKNVRSMLYVHQTPPTMSLGIRSNAEVAVRAGLKYILFATFTEQQAKDIDSYLKSLKPVISPYTNKGKLTDEALKGKVLFENAGCRACHSGPLYTDLKKHDVRTGKGMDKDKPFDTPTLLEVWRTGPYLYDGRAATIKDVLTIFSQDDAHGVTSDLTEKQIQQLEKYILSL